MLILAIDTSGRHGSVALCRGDANTFETLQLMPLEGGTYSARLMPTISSLLQANGLLKENLDGLVAVSGPGSFTGLRVGLATVKGLCEILGKPLATVSMLEAIAVTHGSAGETVTALLDAGRSEVYIGEYRVAAAGAGLVREYIAKLADLAAKASTLGGRVITPDAQVGDALRAAGAEIALISPVKADGIGRIGLRKLLAADIVDVASVDVNYIRRSDAEIFAKPNR